MKNPKRYPNRRRLTALILVIALVYTTVIGGFSKPRFTDVPDNHWAAQYINTMADGGLISGYGNGQFGPANQFRVDHLAKIICAAKGHPFEAKNGFWAYGAIEYCINDLKCLPDMGEITAENYSVPCTRELAFYMLVTALGTQNAGAKKNITGADIPDFSSISFEYRDAVLTAYQYGLTIGYTADLSFNPKGLLNRAQAAAIMCRAGYTTAAEIPVEVPVSGKNLPCEDLYKAIKAMPGVNWEETNGTRSSKLVALNPQYGGVTVEFSVGARGGTGLSIQMPEQNKGNWYANGNLIDVNGKVVNDIYDANGKMVCASGYSYSARQLVRKILEIAYPTGGAEAYAAMKSVFLGETYEYAGSNKPNALRWMDGRLMLITMNDDTAICNIEIGEMNDTETYDMLRAKTSSNRQMAYVYKCGILQNRHIAAYELNKW